jgi:hypothetical protein
MLYVPSRISKAGRRIEVMIDPDYFNLTLSSLFQPFLVSVTPVEGTVSSLIHCPETDRVIGVSYTLKTQITSASGETVTETETRQVGFHV